MSEDDDALSFGTESSTSTGPGQEQQSPRSEPHFHRRQAVKSGTVENSFSAALRVSVRWTCY